VARPLTRSTKIFNGVNRPFAPSQKTTGKAEAIAQPTKNGKGGEREKGNRWQKKPYYYQLKNGGKKTSNAGNG